MTTHAAHDLRISAEEPVAVCGLSCHGDHLVRLPPFLQTNEYREALKVLGGAGSGDFAHAGRPGEVGGSGEGGGPISYDEQKNGMAKAQHQMDAADNMGNVIEGMAGKGRSSFALTDVGEMIRMQGLGSARAEDAQPVVRRLARDLVAAGHASFIQTTSLYKKGRVEVDGLEIHDIDKARLLLATSSKEADTRYWKYRDAPLKTLGGAGSGDFGHGGREGQVGGSSRSGEANYSKKGGWQTKKGQPLPEHIASLHIPPGWKDVKYDPDPKAEYLVEGKDSKGRTVKIYSAEHKAAASESKFARVQELIKKRDEIKEENDRNATDKVMKEQADCMALIINTGIRPGSDTNTKAEKQAYGATTLQGRHVVKMEDGSVRLWFVGKKGVDLDIPVTDKKVASMLLTRKAAAGKNGNLFETDDKALLDYAHTLDGGSFKTKDFRTMVGTTTAISTIKGMSTPSSFKEYKNSVMEVAKAVSTKLGNTPTIALQSYIHPAVFTAWRKPEWERAS